jgi:hypothetical protein
MPEISRFYGLVIYMVWNEPHPIAHIHARRGKGRGKLSGTFSVQTGEMIAGDLGSADRTLVKAWIIIHQGELLENWRAAREHKQVKKIAPLR